MLEDALKAPFWQNHKIGDEYELTNRDGSVETCKIVYYPTGNYSDYSAIIEIQKSGYIDFREVPIRFLKKC